MLCHLTTHVITENFTVDTQSLATNAAIKLELNRLMLIAMSKLFWFFIDVDSMMFGRKFRGVIVLITL